MALHRPGWAPIVAAAVVLLLPTVVINGADWGQCDSIYAAFCAGSLYFLLRHRPIWAGVLLGAAIAFKLQAVFFLPVFLLLLLAFRTRGRTVTISLIVAGATFVAALLPALAAGASPGDLLAVYPDQVGSGSVPGGGGRGLSSLTQNALTQNAPSFYQWIPSATGSQWRYLGLVLAGLGVLTVAILVLGRRGRLSMTSLLVAAGVTGSAPAVTV